MQNNWIRVPGAALLLCLSGQAGHAGLCDYKPSVLIGKAGTVAAEAGRTALGVYSLMYNSPELVALGTSAAGVSASTATASANAALSSAGTAAAAPAAVTAGAVALAAGVAVEGICYFRVDKVTDPYEVRRILEAIAAVDPAMSIVSTDKGDSLSLEVKGEQKLFLMRKLYIADGKLRYRDWGPNRNLGQVLLSAPPAQAETVEVAVPLAEPAAELPVEAEAAPVLEEAPAPESEAPVEE